jgi:hypothetical protein
VIADYSTIVIQYGYVTLFVAACPVVSDPCLFVDACVRACAQHLRACNDESLACNQQHTALGCHSARVLYGPHVVLLLTCALVAPWYLLGAAAGLCEQLLRAPAGRLQAALPHQVSAPLSMMSRSVRGSPTTAFSFAWVACWTF